VETEKEQTPTNAGVPPGNGGQPGATQPRSSTIGTGSALALGCVGIVLLILLLAFLAKFKLGVW
jgi:hypothetical protein